ncbi:MAG: hypothetical protein DME59_03685 [Verrucomicrobia bacterium]|nr:MAG: hypothetical protein DME59_03685 [Verrucomicrobiota bacterium]
MAPWILSPFIECAPSQTSDFLRVFALIFRLWAEKESRLRATSECPCLGRCRYGKDKQSGKVAITVCHGGKNEVLSAPGNRQAGQ